MLSMILTKSLLAVLLAGVSAPDCGEQVCTASSESDKPAKWVADERLSKGKRNEERKKNKRYKDVEVSVELVGGRGTIIGTVLGIFILRFIIAIQSRD